MTERLIAKMGLRHHKGAFYMVLATTFLLIMQACVKALHTLPSTEVIVIRSFFTTVFTLLLLRKHRVSVVGKNKKLLAVRGLVGTLGMVGGFYAMQKLPLATSVSLGNLSPFMGAVFGIVFLRERMHWLQWAGFVSAIAGVVVLKGFDDRVALLPVLAMLGATVATGITYNLVRFLRHSDHPLTIIFYLSFFSLVGGIVLTGFGWEMPNTQECLLGLLLGLSTQLYQIYVTRALHSDRLAKIMPLKYGNVVLAVLIGMVFFQEAFTLPMFLGISLIVAGIFINLSIKKSLAP